MILGSAVVRIWPNVPLLILVSGLLNSAWLKMLKNSARNSSFKCSPCSGVVLESAKSKLVRPGPRKKFLGKLPYVERLGFATTWASDGNSVGPGVQGKGLLLSPQR